MDMKTTKYAVVKLAGKYTYYRVKGYRPYECQTGQHKGKFVWRHWTDVTVTQCTSAAKTRRIAESLGLIVEDRIGGLHNQPCQLVSVSQ